MVCEIEPVARCAPSLSSREVLDIGIEVEIIPIDLPCPALTLGSQSLKTTAYVVE
jgi:hypothetical protein